MKNLFASSILHDKAEKKKYRWQIALSVLALFVLGSILNIPFSREVKRLNIEAGNIAVKLNESALGDTVKVVISSLILGAIIVFIGLWISSRANLGAPLIARIFSKKPISPVISSKAVWSSILLAIVVALLLLGLFELQKAFYPVQAKLARPSKQFYFLVSFSAGITEEIIFRLGLMSFIVVLFQFLKKSDNPSDRQVWAGIFISALIFGLMHLPLSKNFVDLTPFTVAITMIGNLVTGTTFGWIFWRRGLLVAMASHIAFDLVFHVFGSPYA